MRNTVLNLARRSRCSRPEWFAAPAAADSARDQDSAREEMRAGNVLTLRQIERIVVPQIERRNPDLHYLTPEWDEVALAYRLKFINKKGRIVGRCRRPHRPYSAYPRISGMETARSLDAFMYKAHLRAATAGEQTRCAS